MKTEFSRISVRVKLCHMQVVHSSLLYHEQLANSPLMYTSSTSHILDFMLALFIRHTSKLSFLQGTFAYVHSI